MNPELKQRDFDKWESKLKEKTFADICREVLNEHCRYSSVKEKLVVKRKIIVDNLYEFCATRGHLSEFESVWAEIEERNRVDD